MIRYIACVAAFFAATVTSALAQDYPTRPITLVVPLSAGGTADLLCRLAADRASRLLGQQIVVDNRAGGAGGRVGTEFVLHAPPDGYTLLCAPSLTYSTRTWCLPAPLSIRAAWSRSACLPLIR